jgi:type I restriction enzyme R subunit
VKVKPISILDEDFEKGIKSHSRTKTKAAEIEHAIRHHLDVDLDDDPELRASFAEELNAILEEFRDNWDHIFAELEKLRQRIIHVEKEPTYGLSRKKQMPFFRMLKKEVFGDAELDEDAISSLVPLTQQIFSEVERELKLAGFWEAVPAQNKLKADIQRTLLQPEQSKLPGLVANRQRIISRVMEIAQKNNDIILYANE